MFTTGESLKGASISYPFEVVNGSVRAQLDPNQALRSQIIFFISSHVGERVMRPNWGIDVMNSYMALGLGVKESLMEAVEEGLRLWFPGIVVKSLTAEQSASSPSTFNLTLLYGISEDDTDELVRIPVLVGNSEIPFYEGAV